VSNGTQNRGGHSGSRGGFLNTLTAFFSETCTAPTREPTFSQKHPKRSTLGRPWGHPVVLLGDFWAPRDAVGESLGLTFGKPSKTQSFYCFLNISRLPRGPSVKRCSNLREPVHPEMRFFQFVECQVTNGHQNQGGHSGSRGGFLNTFTAFF